MNLRNFAAILGVVCLAVAAQSYIAQSKHDILVNTINNLLRQVDKQYDAANKNLYRDLLKGLHKGRQQAVKDFLSEGSSSAKSTIKQIKLAAKVAKRKGVDITRCSIDDTVQMVKKSPNVYINLVGNCTNSADERGLAVVRQTQAELRNMKTEMKQLLKEAKQCPSKDEACWIKISAKVKDAQDNVPRRIEDLNTKTIVTLVKMNTKMLVCKGPSLEKLAAFLRMTLDSSVACIKSVPQLSINTYT